ncbi:hypothetical protein ACVIJ6_005104 [Bradyrhizobium sp. USDA 4369]
MLLGLVAIVFIAAQLALILRVPVPSFFPWTVVAAVGAATVLSFAILADYFPRELAGRANGALNLFHIGMAFAVQYGTGVDGFAREGVVQHLFAMAVALGLGAILLGTIASRLRKRGVGPEMLLGLVAIVFIAAQLALILRVPVPSFFPWTVVAAVGAATVLSFAILADYFPRELAGRANGALNLFHIGMAFAVQYGTGVVVHQWTLEAGHYPAIAYQTAFAVNLIFQIAAWIWFVMPRGFLHRGKAAHLRPIPGRPPPYVRLA